MTAPTTYLKGSWNVICDVCGRQYKAESLQMRWDGLMVCHGDWEPRQPQDFVRGVADQQAVPWSRPEAADRFIYLQTTLMNIFYSSRTTATIGIRVQYANTSLHELDGRVLNQIALG